MHISESKQAYTYEYKDRNFYCIQLKFLSEMISFTQTHYAYHFDYRRKQFHKLTCMHYVQLYLRSSGVKQQISTLFKWDSDDKKQECIKEHII